MKLKDVCIKGTSNIRQKDVNDSGRYPVYGAAGPVGFMNSFQYDEPYVGVVKDGAGIGRATYLPSNSSIIGTMQALIPKKNVLPKYLYYAVSSMHLEKYYSGATIPHIYFKNYKYERFVLVSKKEQEQIIWRFSLLEKMISNKQQQLLKLDELIKARFVEMFGDPVNNQKGWKISKIEDVVENNKYAIKAGPFGSALKKEFYVSQGYKVYGQEQVIRNDPSFGSYYISKDKYEELKNCKVKAGDILISLVGTYGKLLIIPQNYEPGIINPRLMKVSFNRALINSLYFKYFFQSDAEKKILINNTHGGTMGILNVKIIRNIKIPLPPISLQNEFANFVRQVDKSKVAVQKSLDETQKLFNSLMQEYFG